MKNVMILCGGESGEHEVSLQSANSILREIPRDKYNVIPVGVDKNGNWWTGQTLLTNIEDPSRISLREDLSPADLKKGMLNGTPIDVVFSVIHGTHGEDGCMQGLFRMQKIPVVGSDVLGSSAAMDKDLSKRLLLQADLPVARCYVFHKGFQDVIAYEEVAENLGTILFVKPASLGSSIGISKCRNAEEYNKAVDLAFTYDRKILVEEFIDGREVEVAVLGNQEVRVSLPGEIIPGGDFYSYDSKYIDGESTKYKIPTQLDEHIYNKIKEVACKAFSVLELSDLARVDFFVLSNGNIILNEVNTLPGFTSISMYPKLWGFTGIAYPDLIDKLIQLALERQAEEAKLKRYWI